MVPERRTSVRASRIANGDTAPSRVTGTANSRDAAISVESVPAPAAKTTPWSRQSAQLDRAAVSLGWSRALNACKPGAHVSRGRGPTSLAPLFRQVADRLDVVAVRIVRVGAVVMLVVLRPEPRLAVVLAARG